MDYSYSLKSINCEKNALIYSSKPFAIDCIIKIKKYKELTYI